MKPWDPEAALLLEPGATLLWVHEKRHEFPKLSPEDPKLVRKVTIKWIREGLVKTDFGTYRLEDGKNSAYACGCKRFCDCYGKLWLTE